MNLISQYHFGYYLLCLLLGAAYALFLYRKDKNLIEFSKQSIALLFALRLLAVGFIAMLLLAPLLRYFSKSVEKPIVILALDRSASMKSNPNDIDPRISQFTWLCANSLPPLNPMDNNRYMEMNLEELSGILRSFLNCTARIPNMKNKSAGFVKFSSRLDIH